MKTPFKLGILYVDFDFISYPCMIYSICLHSVDFHRKCRYIYHISQIYIYTYTVVGMGIYPVLVYSCLVGTGHRALNEIRTKQRSLLPMARSLQPMCQP